MFLAMRGMMAFQEKQVPLDPKGRKVLPVPTARMVPLARRAEGGKKDPRDHAEMMEHRGKLEAQGKWVPWEILALRENLVTLGFLVLAGFRAQKVNEGTMELLVHLGPPVNLGLLGRKAKKA